MQKPRTINRHWPNTVGTMNFIVRTRVSISGRYHDCHLRRIKLSWED